MLDMNCKWYKILNCNLANFLTFARLLFTVVLFYMVQNMYESRYSTKAYVLFLLVSVVIWGTDYFDGKLARKLDIASNFGAFFDVAVDFIFVFSIHYQYIRYRIIPTWFMFVILEKIINYFITSKIVSQHSKGKFQFVRDPVGKHVSASFFVTPLIFCTIYKFCNYDRELVQIILVIITGFALYSSFCRIKFVVQMMLTKVVEE